MPVRARRSPRGGRNACHAHQGLREPYASAPHTEVAGRLPVHLRRKPRQRWSTLTRYATRPELAGWLRSGTRFPPPPRTRFTRKPPHRVQPGQRVASSTTPGARSAFNAGREGSTTAAHDEHHAEAHDERQRGCRPPRQAPRIMRQRTRHPAAARAATSPTSRDRADRAPARRHASARLSKPAASPTGEQARRAPRAQHVRLAKSPDRRPSLPVALSTPVPLADCTA
jgi:hypothetical protein